MRYQEVKQTINKKRINHKIASSLILAIFFSTILTATAQTNNPINAISSWQPPENFIDPVSIKIQEFKYQGLNDQQITTELAKLGMGWYPKTGATWIGRALTPEEKAKMPTRDPAAPTLNDGNYILELIDRKSCMRTNSASWTGIASEIVSGSMSVASGETRYHYLCMQLGNLDNAANWVETVLTHNLDENYKWYTFDNDEGEFLYYMDKNTELTYADTYVILLDGSYDGIGWRYHVWINYNWVRSGHLTNLWVQAGLQKEVFGDTGTFTEDEGSAVFYRNWVHNTGGWLYWTNSIDTWWATYEPVCESHSIEAAGYRWETWVD